MDIPADISSSLGEELLQEGLRMRSGPVDEVLARIRSGSVGSLAPPPPSSMEIKDHAVRDYLRVRSYRPLQGAPKGLLINIHGGGWVAGSVDRDDARCRLLSEKAACLTISIDYRLAPEAPFPAAVDDCAVAIAWAIAQSRLYGILPHQVAVLGASAGANLAVAALLQIAAGRHCPMPALQILLYPMCDAGLSFPSYRENERGNFLSSDDVSWYWDRYADTAARQHSLASILRAPDFSKMPRSLLITCERDPLRDEGEALAQRFSEDGVSVNCLRYLGAIHGFLSLAPNSHMSKIALKQIVSEILDAFAA
jgi:acetyl esterase